MTDFSTPYNFVPLASHVMEPCWQESVSQDVPFRDGWCGELKLRLRTHTPLCVGDVQQPAAEASPGRVAFFRTPQSALAIPGSSIKGMLRSVLEIAAFGRFQGVQDRRLGVRDLTRSDNFYCKKIVQSPVSAGWLHYDSAKGRWRITPCKFTRIHQADIIKCLKLNDQRWKQCKSAPAEKRYALIGQKFAKLRFAIEQEKNSKVGIAKQVELATAGELGGSGEGKPKNDGLLVVTGQPGPDFTKPKAKQREFIFYEAEGQPVTVPADIMADFNFIHADSGEWAMWRRELNGLEPGVPVFYHPGPDGCPETMGLAMMYRLAYEYTLHDAIHHTSPVHLDNQHYDLAELIFGAIREEQEGSLRGRVNIGLARSAGGAAETTVLAPVILNGPKPTFYPAYLRQEGADYTTLMDEGCKLSGWKRYPVKREHLQYPQGKAAGNNKVQVRLETVPAGAEFELTMRIHNLRDVELGALCWALDFGGRADHRHGLGMGKPFGLGQVSLEIIASECEFRPNDPQREVVDDIPGAACAAFVSLMDSYWNSLGEQGNWEDCPQLRELLAMASPEEAQGRALEYAMAPKDFQDAKNKKWKLETYTGQAAASAKVKGARSSPDRSEPAYTIEQQLKALHERRLAEEAARAAQSAKAAREAEKEKMSEDQRLLAEVEDSLKDAAEQETKTALKRIAKALNDAYKDATQHAWPEHSIQELRRLAEGAASLKNEKVRSAANKICRDL